MSSTYGGVSFRIILERGAPWPLPEHADDGARRYRARILLADRAAYETLAGRVSIVTIKRAGGLIGGKAFVTGGYGAGTLSVPAGAGETDAYTAYLVGFAPEASPRAAAWPYAVRCEWVVTAGPL